MNSRPLGNRISFSKFEVFWQLADWWSNVPDEPEEALGGSVLFGLEFVTAEVLDIVALDGRGQLTVADFLSHGNVRRHHFRHIFHVHIEIRTLMLPSMSFLTGEKATEPRASTRRQRKLAN